MSICPPPHKNQVCGSAFLAVARNKLCWVVPTHASSIAGIPRHTQWLLVEVKKGGPYAIILPLLPNNSKATLQPAKYVYSCDMSRVLQHT